MMWMDAADKLWCPGPPSRSPGLSQGFVRVTKQFALFVAQELATEEWALSSYPKTLLEEEYDRLAAELGAFQLPPSPLVCPLPARLCTG